MKYLYGRFLTTEPISLSATLAAFAAPNTVVSCPAIQNEKYNQLMEQLNALASLTENWDGYGGVEISTKVISQARSLVNTQFQLGGTPSLPEISPTPNGTLVVEWQDGQGEAAIEIGNARVTGFVKSPGAPRLCISGDSATLSPFLPSFVGPLLNPAVPKADALTRVEYETTVNG